MIAMTDPSINHSFYKSFAQSAKTPQQRKKAAPYLAAIRNMKTEGRRILKSGQSIANSGGKKKEIMRNLQITGMQKE